MLLKPSEVQGTEYRQTAKMRNVNFITSSSFIVGAIFTALLFSSLVFTHTYSATLSQYTLSGSADLAAIQQLSNRYTLTMIGLMGSVVLLSFIIAWYVVNRINRMSNTIADIMNTGNLSARLEIDSNWDDLSKLSLVTNRMLQALESMVHDVKTVSDNIAHDLRTPLTRLRADIELSASNHNKHKLLSEVDNLLAIFNSLLRIADIEAEKQTAAFKQHKLDTILEDVVSFYDVLADEKQITLTSDFQAIILHCDRDLIFQAIANILDNAIKFTPEQGHIHITLTASQSLIQLNVCDTGPGVPDPLKEKLTQRLYRVEHSRNTPGNGLGLALVAAVMKLHQGQISFSDACTKPVNLPGLCCSLTFKI